MKKLNFLVAAFTVAFAFNSCGTSDNSDEGTIAVRFSAGIGEVTVDDTGVRATDNNWKEYDDIGIFMIQYGEKEGEGEDNSSILAENKRYWTKDGTGGFEAVEGNEIYYPMDGSSVNFVAYYPYNAGRELNTDFVVIIDDQEKQNTFDLLYCDATKGYSKKDENTVTLTFAHKLSKLVMNCEAGAGLVADDLKDMTIVIKGMKTRSMFNLSTGLLGDAAEKNDIIPLLVENGKTYNAIIMPGNYGEGEITVEFTLGSDKGKFEWKVGNVTFVGGHVNTYKLTLSMTGVDASGTITPWSDGEEGSGSAT